VQRIWREEGLRVPAQAPKRRRLGTSTVPASRLRAEWPNQVWALDFIFDATSDGRPLKSLSMCDEFTRESLASRVSRSITADDVVAALDVACAERGAPEFIRCDNGPELVAAAIRDWCRFMGTGTAYIEPGSPWENPFVESFNGKLRDELFAREVFDTVMEARVLHADYTYAYNHHRPHSALGYLTPAAFAAVWKSRMSIASNKTPCNGIQRPERARSDTQRLVVADCDQLPSAAAAILADGPVIHQDPS
jgi:putative transposase